MGRTPPQAFRVMKRIDHHVDPPATPMSPLLARCLRPHPCPPAMSCARDGIWEPIDDGSLRLSRKSPGYCFGPITKDGPYMIYGWTPNGTNQHECGEPA